MPQRKTLNCESCKGSSQPWGCTECLGYFQALQSHFSPVHTAPCWNLSVRPSQAHLWVRFLLGPGAGRGSWDKAPGRTPRALQQLSPALRTEALGSCPTGLPCTKKPQKQHMAKPDNYSKLGNSSLISVNYPGEEENNFLVFKKVQIHPKTSHLWNSFFWIKVHGRQEHTKVRLRNSDWDFTIFRLEETLEKSISDHTYLKLPYLSF